MPGISRPQVPTRSASGSAKRGARHERAGLGDAEPRGDDAAEPRRAAALELGVERRAAAAEQRQRREVVAVDDRVAREGGHQRRRHERLVDAVVLHRLQRRLEVEARER